MPKSSSSSSDATRSNESLHEAASASGLSALIDGEADAASTARLCEQWRSDDRTRCDWHAYQLIGDVLRSDDLASTAQADSAFLLRLRSRLAVEPAIVAPQDNLAPADKAILVDAPLTAGLDAGRAAGRYQPRRWATPVAVAAGFMAVAGVMLVNGLTLGPSAPVQTLASSASMTPLSPSGSAAGTNGVQTVSSIVPSQSPQADNRAEPRTVVASGQLIRNARLDRYLAAHKQFGGSSAPGTPLGYLRSASAEAGQ